MTKDELCITCDINETKSNLTNVGISFFSGNYELNDFSNFCKNFGTIYFHRDSNESGITVVKNKMDSNITEEGFVGLTNNDLFPHTDRSTIKNPPNVLILYCKYQSGQGGETTLIDTKKILSSLIEKFGLKFPLLEKNNTIFSDNIEMHKGNIFEVLEDGSYFTRFRNDKFAYFNSEVINILPEFYRLIKENTFTLKLEEGQGYIINNGRYLHGRNGFNGSREMWRILLHDNFLKQKGFNL